MNNSQEQEHNQMVEKFKVLFPGRLTLHSDELVEEAGSFTSATLNGNPFTAEWFQLKSSSNGPFIEKYIFRIYLSTRPDPDALFLDSRDLEGGGCYRTMADARHAALRYAERNFWSDI